MAITLPRREDAFGLVLALAAHGALLAWLVLHPPAPNPLPPPERMTVILSDDAGLTSTAPNPEPASASAPQMGEAQPAPAPATPPEPVAKPAPKALPIPVPVPIPLPRPVHHAVPKPAPKPVPKPAPKAPPKPVAKPHPPTKHAVWPPVPESGDVEGAKPTAKPGAQRIGADFLKGADTPTHTAKPASAGAASAGPAVKAALAGAISRSLKPKWIAPQGVDADKLVTILTWDLGKDGSLTSGPRVVRQEGINDDNRAQAARHAEQAMRAVRLAAPFALPPQYYNAWKHVAEFRFDRKLSQ